MGEVCEISVKMEKNDCEKFIVEVDNGINMRNKGEIDKDTEKVNYRHRFMHTACLCFSMFSLGWRNGLVGPTFPDLRLITNEDLSTSSWIFTAISFGGLLGSVCGGFAYDRFNRIAVFMCIVIGLGIVAGVAPWCTHFAAMFIVHILHGGFASALDTAVTADMTLVWWYQAGPYMQAVHGIFSVGAIVSPFVAEPYLAKKIDPYTFQSSTQTLNGTVSRVVTSTASFKSNPPGQKINASVFTYETTSMQFDYSILNSTVDTLNHLMSSENLTDQPVPSVYGETFIYIPYSLATLICLIAASLYLIVYFIYGNVYNLPVNSYGDLKKIPQREHFLSKKMKTIFTVLLALTLTFYVMGERSFIGFLMTFIITELDWSKSRGSSASSIFWIAFAVGRLSGIIIVKYINISAVIMTFFLMITTGAALFWIAVIYKINLLVWMSIAIVGYGMSVIFASIFLWISENVRKLTGKMVSVIFIFFSSGAMVFPILIGHLMDKVSQMWFIYSQLVLFCAMCTLFIFVLRFFNVLKRRHQRLSLDVQ